MENREPPKDSIKEALKKRIKEQLKKELLEEIYNELKLEENDLTEEILKKNIIQDHKESVKVPVKNSKSEEDITITVKAILKIASHSLKYAHSKVPREEWVEIIGLLAGKFDDDGITLHVEDAYPMGHGTAVSAEIKDYKNFVRAYQDIKKNNLFICGWYHSHPSYGCFMSNEDIGTQARYQKLWDKSIALVIDPYLIDGTSFGFEIYRADIKTNKWFKVPFSVKGALDVQILPEILEFMNPIIEGKPAYLEYDDD